MTLGFSLTGSGRVLPLKRRPGDSILRFDGEFDSLDAIEILHCGRMMYLQYVICNIYIQMAGCHSRCIPGYASV